MPDQAPKLDPNLGPGRLRYDKERRTIVADQRAGPGASDTAFAELEAELTRVRIERNECLRDIRRLQGALNAVSDAVLDVHKTAKQVLAGPTVYDGADRERAMRDVLEWIDAWISNPVTAYSVHALDGLFKMSRDKIADAMGRTDSSGPRAAQEE